MPSIKNIIIFISIGAIIALAYVFLIKSPAPEVDNLISTQSSGTPSATTSDSSFSPVVAQDFLILLLSVKNIKLDDAIFSTEGFTSLRDSSIILTPDGNEGRPNPFAPIGSDLVATPISAGVGTSTDASSAPASTPTATPKPPTTYIPMDP